MPDNSGERVIRVPPSFAQKARIGSLDRYRALYDRSLSDPEGFWAEAASRIDWIEPWEKVLDRGWTQQQIDSRVDLVAHLAEKQRVDFLVAHYPGPFAESVKAR